MNSTLRFCLICLICCSGFFTAHSQSNIVTTIAGNGTSGFSGDGGSATLAMFNQPSRIAIDAAGNKYISDCANHRIRKINTSGIISTYAGNGTAGFSGDGGAAVAANLSAPVGIALDAAGNLYIADQNNYRIRKVTPAGIISTVAGNGSGFSGDGSPAISAGIGQVGGVAVDATGNIYIAGLTHRIRKVNTSGIISTIAGNGIAASGGDGGLATVAQVNDPWDVIIDAANNIYFTELAGNRVRKINAAGIINTVAGNGTAGYAGDGGPATTANIAQPDGIALDNYGNLYFGEWANSVVRKVQPSGIISTIAGVGGVAGFSGDGGPANLAHFYSPRGLAFDAGFLHIVDFSDSRVRKFGVPPAASSDSFSIDYSNTCSSVGFIVATHSYMAGMGVVSLFGDGSMVTTPVVASASGSGGYASFSHTYGTNGTYSVKHVLSYGTSPVDSVSHSVIFKLCNTISVHFYVDDNTNCNYDPATDPHVYLPITVEIDSNGTAVDTFVTPGGLSYRAYGTVGDVYTVKILSMPAGLVLNCPSAGFVKDTVHAVSDSSIATNNFGFNCSSVTGFDIRAHYVSRAGRHTFSGNLIVDNLYCTPQAATLTVDLSDKFPYAGASPSPTSVSGNSMRWDISALSVANSAPVSIRFTGEKSAPWHMAGDTVNSAFLLTPTSGDLSPGNNSGDKLDTVTSSYDPNFIQVTPLGCIPPAATTLRYAIGFENTGNDTAYNIYILDTLPAYLNISTLKIVTATAYMNLTKIKYGSQVILKFDFPNIMLPDSSHHDVCHGMVIYEIDTKAGLADMTNIPNRAGIYFDTNPVVMTNSASNTINCPTSIQDVAIRQNIAIYPNPATDELTVTTKNVTFTSFTISNAIGLQVLAQDISNAQTRMNIKALAPGVYYISLKGAQGSEVRKFVKW